MAGYHGSRGTSFQIPASMVLPAVRNPQFFSPQLVQSGSKLVSRIPLPVRSQQAYALPAGGIPLVDTAVPAFTPKPSGSAVCPDAAASSLSLLSHQKLPGPRLTPISRPASFLFFHPTSFRNAFPPRFHGQKDQVQRQAKKAGEVISLSGKEILSLSGKTGYHSKMNTTSNGISL